MPDLKFGPLNISLATQTLQLIIKATLSAPNKVKFYIENKTFFCKMGDIEVNLSNILKKANFSHIYFSSEDSKQYAKQIPYFEATQSISNLFGFFWGSKKIEALTSAEKHAISAYTGNSYYHQINSLLRNDFHLFGSSENDNNYALKNVMLIIGMLASGLNKIETTIGNTPPSYRRESHLKQDEIALRQSLIKKGGITNEHAFLSTSSSKQYSSCTLTLKHLYGKSISEFSQFPWECEYLLIPGCIQWTKCTMKNGKTHFEGVVVNPLVEGLDDPTKEEVATFKKLKTWIEKEGVATTFITEFTQKQILVDNYNPSPLPKAEEIPPSSHIKVPNLTMVETGVITPDKPWVDAVFPSLPNINTKLTMKLLLAAALGILSYKLYIVGMLPSLPVVLIAGAFLSTIYIAAFCLKKLFGKTEEVKYQNKMNAQTDKYLDLVSKFKAKFVPQNQPYLSEIQDQDQFFITILENIYDNAPDLKFDKHGKSIPENQPWLEKDKTVVMQWGCEQLETLIALKYNHKLRLKKEKELQATASKKFS